MIRDLAGLRIFVRPGSTDMRKQIDGLAALVRDALGCDPLDGSLYLFCGMGGRRLKALYWDRNGFCLWMKRLEEDRFPWPELAKVYVENLVFWQNPSGTSKYRPRYFRTIDNLTF